MNVVTFQYVAHIVICFCGSMLGVIVGYRVSDALDRSRRAYVKALEACDKSKGNLIAVLKEENASQQTLIRQMVNDRSYFQPPKQKSDPKSVN